MYWAFEQVLLLIWWVHGLPYLREWQFCIYAVYVKWCVSSGPDCSAVLCIRPNCSNPILRPGECCPFCPNGELYMQKYHSVLLQIMYFQLPLTVLLSCVLSLNVTTLTYLLDNAVLVVHVVSATHVCIFFYVVHLLYTHVHWHDNNRIVKC